MTKAGGILAHVSTRVLWSPHSFLVCYLQVLIALSLRLYWLSRGYDNTTEESNFLKGDVLVCFCCCCDKCHSPKNLGQERVYFVSHFTREVKAGIWRQELKQRPQGNTTPWLAFARLPASFLLHSRPTCREIVLPTVGRGTSYINKQLRKCPT